MGQPPLPIVKHTSAPARGVITKCAKTVRCQLPPELPSYLRNFLSSSFARRLLAGCASRDCTIRLAISGWLPIRSASARARRTTPDEYRTLSRELLLLDYQRVRLGKRVLANPAKLNTLRAEGTKPFWERTYSAGKLKFTVIVVCIWTGFPFIKYGR